MRRINIAACSLMLLAAASAPGMAQGNMGGGRMDPAQMTQRTSDRLPTGLALSAAQTDSVKASNARFSAEAQSAMASGDMRSKMMDMRTRQRTELRAILTGDQQAVFDKNIADMEKARASRPQP